MSEYKVNWVINIDAKSAKEAAQEALAIMQDTESTATVFDVIDKDDEHIIIDLLGVV